MWTYGALHSPAGFACCLLVALGACTGKITTSDDQAGWSPNPGDPCQDAICQEVRPPGLGLPPPESLKLLRGFEFENTVRSLFGESIEIKTPLPTDLAAGGFTFISAASDCRDAVAIETYETASIEIAAQVFASSTNPLSAAGCAPKSATDPCIPQFLRTFGLQAWRRPWTDLEVERYTGLVNRLTQDLNGDLKKAIEMTVAAIMQSPFFLYRVELGESAHAADEELKVYTPYQMATRLSYSLWETTPDEILLGAAERGELGSRESIQEHAERMLQDTRSAAALRRFWREFMGSDRVTLDNFPRPGVTESVLSAMRLEGEKLAERLAEPGAETLGYLTERQGYWTSELAGFYGADNMSPGTKGMVDLPQGRVGFLTTGVFLLSQAHPNQTSPTRRGRYITERVLCRHVPDPPADVQAQLAVPDDGTTRDFLEQHAKSPACSGCHNMTDPLGFALESFDQLGRKRDLEGGLPIKTSAEFEGHTFENAIELTEILAGISDTQQCLVRHVLRNLTGGIEAREQEPFVDTLVASMEGGADLRQLVAEAVASDLFRYSRGQIGIDTEDQP